MAVTARVRKDLEGAAAFSRRAVLLGLANLAAIGGIGARLHQLQVVDAGGFGALAEDNRTRQFARVPVRGRILDAAGTPLAWSRESFRLTLDVAKVGDLVELRNMLAELAPVIGLDGEGIERLLARARRQGARHPLMLADDVTFDVMAAFQVRVANLPGLQAETVTAREYSPVAARSMAHIIGTMGAVERRALDDPPLLQLSTFRVGKTGVEAGMEMQLRGVAGTTAIEVDSRGNTQRSLRDVAPIAGRDVTLSLDIGLQTKVMERLAREGRPGAVVAIDVVTGELAVMASTPSYDPATLIGTGAATGWRALSTDREKPLLNRAIAGQYPPGSTFKMVTALAALEAGVVTTKEKIECWGDVTIAGHTFHCWHRKGHIASTLHKALRESCDCYFYEIAQRVGMEKIAAMGRRLGLGQVYETGLSQHKSGLLPTAAWKRGRSKTGWLTGETLLAGIGQGYVLATPLQLAVMTARIATGRLVTPTVVAHATVVSADTFGDLGISEASLAAVRAGMFAVVNEPGGTGHLADIEGALIQVAGKTGTSQVSRKSAARDPTVKLSVEERDHALFVGYAPASRPKYAVAAVIENAGGGGVLAAPLVGDVMSYLMARDAKSGPPAPQNIPPPNLTPPAAVEPQGEVIPVGFRDADEAAP
jgi:penicillin-binding protein 2